MERTLTSHTGMGKCIESERCHRRRAGVPANTYKPINTAPFQEFKDFFVLFYNQSMGQGDALDEGICGQTC